MSEPTATRLDGSKKTAESRYESLKQERDQFLKRGRECAALTIPAILPPQGFTSSSVLTTPYQSLGARGVRNLASKLLLSLFPTNTAFFQYKIDDQTIEKLGEKRGEFEKALSSRERATAVELDTAVFRPAAFQALMHLIVTGNSLLYLPPHPDDRAQVYRLDQYVVRRDPSGNLLEIIIHERLALASLPEKVRNIVVALPEFRDKVLEDLAGDSPTLDMYTRVYLDNGMWKVCQETCGWELPGGGSFRPGELPYLALRFAAQPGEHYGRAYIEEYLGDLDSLEALCEALVEGAAASARIVFMVDPAGATSLKTVATARTGDTVSGNANDVHVMQVQKQADLQVAKSQADEIATRLSYAFLLHSSVQRKGERVTAEEIRYMASELDDGLGGVYTLLAADFQLPTVRIFEKRMEKRLKVKALPKDIVKPVLISGLEAIGRGHDQKNLQAFAGEIIQVLTPQVALQFLHPSEYLSRAAAGYGIDPVGLVKTADEIEAEKKQQQMMMMVQQLGPAALQQAGGIAKEGMKTPNG